jgi:hypothetical protein
MKLSLELFDKLPAEKRSAILEVVEELVRSAGWEKRCPGGCVEEILELRNLFEDAGIQIQEYNS